VNLYLKQTVCEKSIKQKWLLTLIGTILGLLNYSFTFIFFFVLSPNILAFNSGKFHNFTNKSINCESEILAKSNGSVHIHPNYITGFADAEGSFIISIYKNNSKNSKLN
jgi:hypothetical protein